MITGMPRRIGPGGYEVRPNVIHEMVTIDPGSVEHLNTRDSANAGGSPQFPHLRRAAAGDHRGHHGVPSPRARVVAVRRRPRASDILHPRTVTVKGALARATRRQDTLEPIMWAARDGDDVTMAQDRVRWSRRDDWQGKE